MRCLIAKMTAQETAEWVDVNNSLHPSNFEDETAFEGICARMRLDKTYHWLRSFQFLIALKIATNSPYAGVYWSKEIERNPSIGFFPYDPGNWTIVEADFLPLKTQSVLFPKLNNSTFCFHIFIFFFLFSSNYQCYSKFSIFYFKSLFLFLSHYSNKLYFMRTWWSHTFVSCLRN